MKLEEMKAKLSKKKRLAAAFNIGGASVGAVAGSAVGMTARDLLTKARYEEMGYLLEIEYQKLIRSLESRWMDRYGVEIPRDSATYLQNIQANKAAWGDEYDYVYSLYSNAFKTSYDWCIEPQHILQQSIGIGVGTALVAWALVAGYPTAKYLMCKKKYNKLTKELEKHEELEQAN